ncbi:CAMP phosphodiesterases class-II:metallo-beta-lactamase superfamily [Sulfuriferula multivorans]|uniref:cAMP phosphodiesterases class-II:metallo-beta-lactamase superfamily n=1 Tax=Sulfuriferula multivorans TaxID=1559896 RepID=A0A401JZA5_9PROT|nr:3',5'-cyclic-nucleotide phosphodiesterase [Sulfuriferula multivorans]GCB01954.1 CAMP phosphodiesterases class-II:metallo-beta-lactamase superfamily [Sulfuriferula multivorans]
MKIKVLGCSGGIGGDQYTTALLVDDDILIDAGTGVNRLSMEALTRIDHVFITHSHMDHITSIPLMVDTVARMRDKPLVLHATEATLGILRGHIFNWEIWPDFSRIPTATAPYMRYETIAIGKPVQLGQRRITALPANHAVPAVGYQLDSGTASLVFTGDTTTNDPFWEIVNGIGNLRYLIIETAFSNKEREIAVLSKHLCPSMLQEELTKLKLPVEMYITHLKPGEDALIMREIDACIGNYQPHRLMNDQVFEF